MFLTLLTYGIIMLHYIIFKHFQTLDFIPLDIRLARVAIYTFDSNCK